jgi:histidyl-tRNA synthetase
MALPSILPGFREFQPEDLGLRTFIFRHWRQAAVCYGFQEYDAPVLEPLELFTRKSGPEIEEQLFSFTDKGGRAVTLRPEMTPRVACMVGARAASIRRPVKWFNIGEHFRYERAQKGRLRSFFQFNADIFGEAGPEAELELIPLLIQILSGFGLTQEDFYIRLSDRNLWVHYLESLGVAAETVPGVLSVIDKMERDSAEASTAKLEALIPGRGVELLAAFRQLASRTSLAEVEALVGLDPAKGGVAASDALKARLNDWRRLLGGLDAMGLSPFVQVDLGIVRGLAYYTGFVFEAFDRKGEFRAIAGGGRYDGLVAKLGGPDMAATGFAIGDVVLAELLKARGLAPNFVSIPDVYIVIGGEGARTAAYGDIFALRQAGFRVEYSLREMAFGKQFKAADQAGAKLALIYGDDEVAKGVVKLKDLSAKEEREVPRGAVIDACQGAAVSF